MDPVPLIASLADELRGKTALQMHQLANRMSAGLDFVEALEESPSLLPPSLILAFQLARENGTMPEFKSALADLDTERAVDPAFDEGNHVSRYVGLLFRVFAIGLIFVFISLKVFPEFLKMLEEFGVEPPAALDLVIEVMNLFEKFWVVFLMILVLAVPLYFPAIRMYLRRWNPLTWRQPQVSSSVERRLSLALIAQTSGSLKSAIALILGTPKLDHLFGRLSRVEERMNKGESQWDSLASEKIISHRDAEALMLTSSPETQSWLLRWSANNQQAHQATRSVILLRTIRTVVNVALGLLVALTCMAVFMTLFSIMASLS